jgi:hypothetical protein
MSTVAITGAQETLVVVLPAPFVSSWISSDLEPSNGLAIISVSRRPNRNRTEHTHVYVFSITF